MSTQARSDDRSRPVAAGGSLAYLLKHAWLEFHELTGAALAPYGIDGRELAVLTLLDREASLSQQQAAGRLAIDRTTMVAMIDGLEGKGLVERRTHPGDRRKNLVDLTAAGRRTLHKARRAYDEAERRFLAPLGQAGARRLKDSLHALVTAAAGREPGR